MNRSIPTLVILAVASLWACSPDQGAPKAPEHTSKKKVKKGPRLEGEIHTAQKRQRVLPFIMHQPSMDLRVQCLSYRDELAERGEAVPLCFEEEVRDVAKGVTTLRIEHREGLRTAQAVALLRSAHEAAHFIIDDGGVPYQLLDLAFPARRDALYPRDEIRVMSGSAKGNETLTKALIGLYPKLNLTRVPLGPPASSKAKAPAAKSHDGHSKEREEHD